MNKNKGVSLLEVLIGVSILSMLLAAGNSVLSYSRQQTEKGFWIQQAIAQLRNTTRLVGDKMKQTSYPSTLAIGGSETGKDVVYSLKELREYDDVGRLRMFEKNDSEVYNVHTIDSQKEPVTPIDGDLSIMYFPICEQEVKIVTNPIGGGTPPAARAGKITWVHLVLRPSPTYSVSGLGTLYIEETEKTYTTNTKPYAFTLGKPSEAFNPAISAPTRKRQLITDVQSIKVDTFAIDESRGFYVDDAGTKSQMISIKRNLISLTINCSHPKDGKINLSDQCSVVTRVEQSDTLPTPPSIQLLGVDSSSGKVRVRYNGQESVKQKFDWIGQGSQIVHIYATAIKVKEGNRERLIVASDF